MKKKNVFPARLNYQGVSEHSKLTTEDNDGVNQPKHGQVLVWKSQNIALSECVETCLADKNSTQFSMNIMYTVYIYT